MDEHGWDDHDVVVIGGGAAGLSAALVLARSRRTVTVVDGGQPRNAPAAGVHGFLTRDGMLPAELLRAGRAEVEGYGGRVVDGRVEQVLRDAYGRFTVALADGGRLTARRLLVATGLVDELPDVPGLRERWGRDVLHCPYCHGWEVRDQAVAVLASGPMSAHQALLFRQLTDDVTFLAHAAPPTPEQEEQLLARGVRIVPGPVTGLQVEQDRLVGVRLADGTVAACSAVVVGPYMRARTAFLAGIGLAPVEHPLGIATHLAIDGQGRTDVPGVWAAGNVADPSAQVGSSAAAGAAAAAQINADLVAEDTRLAVEARRSGAAAGRVDGRPVSVAQAGAAR
jgi:thioredoxin reductase